MAGEHGGPASDQPFSFDPAAHAGGTPFASNEPQVYWNQRENASFGGEFHGNDRNSERDALTGRPSAPVVIETRTVNEAVNSYYYEWTDEERHAWAKRMYASGFVNDPNDIEGAFRAWATAVDRASGAWEYGQKRMTPWQAMDLMEGMTPGQAREPKTTTRRDVVLPNAEDANALVYAVFKQANGRAPTDGELSRYRSMLMGKYKANPNVTTTTTDINGNASSVTRQGYTSEAAQFDVLKKAQADPEYGAYQAATTYYNALIEAIGSPG
jgi:hypothetical protein